MPCQGGTVCIVKESVRPFQGVSREIVAIYKLWECEVVIMSGESSAIAFNITILFDHSITEMIDGRYM
jgi:hypothetical protein